MVTVIYVRSQVNRLRNFEFSEPMTATMRDALVEWLLEVIPEEQETYAKGPTWIFKRVLP